MPNLTATIMDATSGIGQAIAKVLGQNGVNLVLVGQNQQILQRVHDNIAQCYPQLELDLIHCNFADQQSREELVKALATLNKPIHYYINNISISDFKLFTQQPQEIMEQMMLINAVYPMQLIQKILPLISISPPGQVINVGSTFGSIGYPGYASYCASQFALRGATEALAREYSKSSIRFRYFSLRVTETNIHHSNAIEMNIRLGKNIDSPEFVAEELYWFLHRDCQSYQVGYPEKISIAVNQILPDLISASINRELPTICECAEKVASF